MLNIESNPLPTSAPEQQERLTVLANETALLVWYFHEEADLGELPKTELQQLEATKDAAFGTLYEQTRQAVRVKAASILRDPSSDEVENVTQEAFSRVYVNFTRREEDISNFGNWILTVAQKTAIRYSQNQTKAPEPSSDTIYSDRTDLTQPTVRNTNDYDRTIDITDQALALRRAIERYDSDRDVEAILQVTEVEGSKHVDVYEELGFDSANALSAFVHRIRRCAREELKIINLIDDGYLDPKILDLKGRKRNAAIKRAKQAAKYAEVDGA